MNVLSVDLLRQISDCLQREAFRHNDSDARATFLDAADALADAADLLVEQDG